MTNPDVYKGRWGGSQCRDSPISRIGRTCECIGNQCKASEKYFNELENIFKYSLSSSGHIAGFICESIQVYKLNY